MDDEKAYWQELRQSFKRYKERLRNPQKYLADAQELVCQNPTDSFAYSERADAWANMGRKDVALLDMNMAIALQPHWTDYETRACILRDLGRYDEALDDLNRAEAMDPQTWATGYGLLVRADTHARLGDEAAALADCARLRDDHWTPGMFDTPKGTKDQVAEELRRRAAAARTLRTPPGAR
jgi:tetratricopeptide (TPR) repeat protein